MKSMKNTAMLKYDCVLWYCVLYDCCLVLKRPMATIGKIYHVYAPYRLFCSHHVLLFQNVLPVQKSSMSKIRTKSSLKLKFISIAVATRYPGS